MPAIEDLDDMSDEKLAQTASELKQKGNTLYSERKFDEALVAYAEAVETCPESYVKDRAIYYGNIAACHFEMGKNDEAVENCTKALELNEDYTKVRKRRALANEKLGTWNALENAMEDLKKLKDSSIEGSVEFKELMAHIRRVEPKMKAKQQQEVDEMLGKLKNLGNGILGKFGMSLDDFNMEKNADGGYSLNMGKK
jgi:tetratricopeptide (TPR) repeat protein